MTVLVQSGPKVCSFRTLSRSSGIFLNCPPLYHLCSPVALMQQCCKIVTPGVFTFCSRFVRSCFVHVLFQCCNFATGVAHLSHLVSFTFCSTVAKMSHCCKNVTVAKLPQTPRVCKLLSCCLSPFWGEILNICHFVTIGHLRLSYTPLTKLQKTCIIVLNTTAYAR